MDTPEQSGGAAGGRPPRVKPRRPIDELNGIGPVEREQVARWIDAHAPGIENALAEGSRAISEGHEWPGAFNQMTYWRTSLSILQQLSWEMRTGRGGPLASDTKRQRKKQSP